jgi:hypothetical protein
MKNGSETHVAYGIHSRSPVQVKFQKYGLTTNTLKTTKIDLLMSRLNDLQSKNTEIGKRMIWR